MTAYISKQLNTKERPIHLWVLLGIIVILAMLYGYFLNAAIISVVSRESLESNIAAVSSTVGSLENRFLADERPLTQDTIGNYGLSAPKEVSYVGQSSGAILTFSGNI